MENTETWKKAGQITAQAIIYGKRLIKPGAKLIEIADAIDNKIIELGAKPAWPSQISLNEVAAHFTADPEDTIILKDQIVSLDVGAQIDGCIGDTAYTVDLSGKHAKLIQAAKEALQNAIKTARIGIEVREIGKVIDETITKHGFQTVKNLTGHGITRWEIHSKPSIPNYDNGDKTTLKKGQVIAIEPFATTGGGMVDEAERGNIFSLPIQKPTRSPFTREIMTHIIKEYKNLPFTTRWLTKKFGIGKTTLALQEMLRSGALHPHPPLVEVNKGLVSVFEKTLLIDDKTEVLTDFNEND